MMMDILEEDIAAYIYINTMTIWNIKINRT